MKKIRNITAGVGGLLLMMASQAWSVSPETALLLDLLKAKGVINQAEADEFAKTLDGKMAEAPPAAPASASGDGRPHSVQSLSDREDRREEKEDKAAMVEEVASTITFSGLLEAGLTSSRYSDPLAGKTKSSDLTLTTAQLSADAFFSHYVNGHLALLYEEDPADPDNSNIILEEALVGIKGGEACPTYVNVGRMYVPFGHFESHFISDPLTLILGETNDTALVAGYVNDVVDLGLGVFKGKVVESGQNDHLNSLVASAKASLPVGTAEGLTLKGGVSYLSNLATSDALRPYSMDDMDDDPTTEILTPGEVSKTVGGLSAFLSLAFAEQFFLEAEYLGALKAFTEGDLNFINADNRKPQAWSLEAAAKISPKLEFALRYGGSDQAGNFLAEDEYGAALLYNLFDNTALTVEYLLQDFQDNSTNRQSTMQLAVEF